MSSKTKIDEDFNKFLDRATDPMLLEPDVIAIAEVCRMVDDFIVEADDAIQAIHGKILDQNPHTVYYALTVLNNVFYKCGNIVHSVIATPEYMELIKDIVQTTEHKKIKEKIITMLEDWADKFKYLPNYCAVQALLVKLNGDSSKKNYKNLKIEKFNNGNNLSTVQNSPCETSVANTGMTKVNNDCIEKFNICININEELDETDKEFECHIKARQHKQKKEYKLLRKELKLPTSSDEENKRCDNRILEVKQPTASSGKNCKDNNNNNIKEESIFTKGMIKVKERRQILEHFLDEYRVSKKEEYYKKPSNNCSDAAVDWEDENIPIKSKTETEEEKFQRDLQRALLQSHDKSFNVNASKENHVGEPRSFSNLQAKDFANDDDDLQKAINLSIIEAQEQNLSTMPKFDENVDDLHLCVAKQLSLDELANSEKISDSHEKKEERGTCLVCYEIKPMRTCVSCNDKCICHECSLSNTCPLC